MTCMAMIDGGGRVHGREEMKREEMMKEIGNSNNGKAAAVGGLKLRCFSMEERLTN